TGDAFDFRLQALEGRPLLSADEALHRRCTLRFVPTRPERLYRRQVDHELPVDPEGDGRPAVEAVVTRDFGWCAAAHKVQDDARIPVLRFHDAALELREVCLVALGNTSRLRPVAT